MNTVGSHFAFLAGVPFEVAALLALVLIKETRQEQSHGGDDGREGEEDSHSTESKSHISQQWCKVMDYFRQDIGGLLSQKSLLLGLLAVVSCRLGRPMLVLTLQYMSARFGWHLSKVSLTDP